MFTPERIDRLERVLRSGSAVEQSVAARVVAQGCRENGITSHQFADTVASLLSSHLVTANAARMQLLAALMQCHLNAAISFERTRDLLFALLLRQIDEALEKADTIFTLALIEEAADFAGANETGILSAIADAYPCESVRACASNALARIKPSLAASWKVIAADVSSSRDTRVKTIKDALFGYGDARMAAQNMFSVCKGQQLEPHPDQLLSVLTLAIAHSDDVVRLAVNFIILETCPMHFPEWQRALQLVADTTVSAESGSRIVFEAVQILSCIRNEMPHAEKPVLDAIARAHEAFISRFDQPLPNITNGKTVTGFCAEGTGLVSRVNSEKRLQESNVDIKAQRSFAARNT